VDHIDEVLSGREDPIFAARRAESFPFRDGQSCQRVIRAVERLHGPRPTLSLLYATQDTDEQQLTYPSIPPV